MVPSRVLVDLPFSLTVRRAARPGRVAQLVQQLAVSTGVDVVQLEACIAGGQGPKVDTAEVDQQFELLFGDLESLATDELEAWMWDAGEGTQRAGRLVLVLLDQDTSMSPAE